MKKDAEKRPFLMLESPLFHVGGIEIFSVILYNESKEKVEGIVLYCGLPLKYKE